MATQTLPQAAVLRSRDFLGRDILDPSSDKIGTIRDLLLDRRTGTVRFLEVDLGTFRKRVVIPVSQVNWGEDALILRDWTPDQVRNLPEYDTDRPLTGDLLDEMAWAYPRFYESDDFDPLSVPQSDVNIVPMSEAKGFQVKRDEPDLRGWSVFGADGERAGKVTDLLVDPAALKVRYLDVDLLGDLYTLKDDRHVLLPVESVDLRERGEDVWVRGLAARDVARLPAYGGGTVDPLVAARVSDAFRDPDKSAAFYDDRLDNR